MADYLDYLMGLGETSATLGSGAMAGLLGMPYGVYKGATSGKIGTPEANRIAEEEARRFMEQYTYQPRGKVAPEMMQTLGGLLESSKLPPVIPEAAMLASIPRQAVAAQAERAGMAAERAVAPMVERTMKKGGLGAGLLSDMTQGTRSPLDVYHGSPHGPFRQFDPTKIGTGEGAQVYGYGHYLGEARGTGERYREVLAGKKLGIDLRNKSDMPSRIAGHYVDLYKTPDEAISALQYEINANPSLTKEAMDTSLAAIELLKSKNKGTGYLYKVDLPDDQIAKMLDWEEQVPESMRQRISQPMMERFKSGATGTSGEKLYKEIQKEFERAGSQNPALDASNFLKEQGVTGIRYLDQMSRQPGVASLTQSQIDARINSLKSDIASGLGDQKRMKEILSSLEAERASHPKLTSNFVVFPGNENLLTIKEINDQPASLLFPTP